jgi:hypothetical protein
MEGCGHELIWGTTPSLVWRYSRKPREHQSALVDVPVWSQTGHILNINLIRYRLRLFPRTWNCLNVPRWRGEGRAQVVMHCHVHTWVILWRCQQPDYTAPKEYAFNTIQTFHQVLLIPTKHFISHTYMPRIPPSDIKIPALIYIRYTSLHLHMILHGFTLRLYVHNARKITTSSQNNSRIFIASVAKSGNF